MSNQQEAAEIQNELTSEYQEILKTLEKRASKSRMAILILIYFMMIVAAIVMATAYYIKTNQSPINDLTSALLSVSEKAKSDAAIMQLNETVQSLTKSINSTSNQTIKQSNNQTQR